MVKCPKCGNTNESTLIIRLAGPKWDGKTYQCRLCKTTFETKAVDK